MLFIRCLSSLSTLRQRTSTSFILICATAIPFSAGCSRRAYPTTGTAPRFAIAVVGDGVSPEDRSIERGASINASQGRGMFMGVSNAFEQHRNDPLFADIAIVRYDDGGLATNAVRHASSLQTNPFILAVIGHGTSGSTKAAAPYYHEAAIPLLMPIATSISVRTPALTPCNSFRLPASDDVQAAAVAYTARRTLQSKRILMARDDSDQAREYSRPLCDEISKYLLDDLCRATVVVDHSNALGVANSIHNCQPDTVIFCGYSSLGQDLIANVAKVYSSYHSDASVPLPTFILTDGCMQLGILHWGATVYITFPTEYPTMNSDKEASLPYQSLGEDAMLMLLAAIRNIRANEEPLSRQTIANQLRSFHFQVGARNTSYRFDNIGDNEDAGYCVYKLVAEKPQEPCTIVLHKNIPRRDITAFRTESPISP